MPEPSKASRVATAVPTHKIFGETVVVGVGVGVATLVLALVETCMPVCANAGSAIRPISAIEEPRISFFVDIEYRFE